MQFNKQRLQRGLSLVEVFVALLVLSVGLIALAKLQVDLVRGSSDARTRTVALALAEEKIEDLRTFARSTDTGTWSVTVNPMAWSYITGPAISTPADTTCGTPCRGGRIPPQTSYTNAPLEVAGVRFKRTWEVVDRPLSAAASPPPGSRTKDVRVTIAWLNEMGVEQQVSVLSNVVEIPPGNVVLASQPILDPPAGPQVLYTPGQAPEIVAVPIDTGTGKRETTKPLPDVQAQGGYAHEVRFDVVNYHLDGANNVVDRREEFVTVNCRCALAGPGRGRTPARVAFTGGVLRDKPGEVITSKSQTGVVLTTGGNGVSQQPALCTICCRDHHDGPTQTVGGNTEYNRYKPTAMSDHQHYLWNSNTNTYTLATNTGAAYDEACRLKRINGIFQVFQDWNLKAIVAMPENDLLNPTIQTAYTSYVSGYTSNQANNSLPTGSLPTFSTTTLAPGGAAQLSGRAVFIDEMPADLVTFLNTSPPPVNVLTYVPFYEINLTKLADWKLQNTNTNTDYATVDGQTCDGAVSQPTLASKIACIANQTIVDETVINVGVYQNYFRGLLKGGPVAGDLDAQVYAVNGNTSVTGTQPLTAAQAGSTPISSEYHFAVAAGQSISGTITKGANFTVNGNTFWSNITVTASSPCTLSGTGSSSRSFTCSVTGGWTGTVTAAWTGHTFAATNNVFPPNVLPAGNVTFVIDP